MDTPAAPQPSSPASAACAATAVTPAYAGIVLTNDGHAILREIDVTHPAAKVSQHLEACPCSTLQCMLRCLVCRGQQLPPFCSSSFHAPGDTLYHLLMPSRPTSISRA